MDTDLHTVLIWRTSTDTSLVGKYPVASVSTFISFIFLDYWPDQDHQTTDGKLRFITSTGLNEVINFFNYFPSAVWLDDFLIQSKPWIQMTLCSLYINDILTVSFNTFMGL